MLDLAVEVLVVLVDDVTAMLDQLKQWWWYWLTILLRYLTFFANTAIVAASSLSTTNTGFTKFTRLYNSIIYYHSCWFNYHILCKYGILFIASVSTIIVQNSSNFSVACLPFQISNWYIWPENCFSFFHLYIFIPRVSTSNHLINLFRFLSHIRQFKLHILNKWFIHRCCLYLILHSVI